MAGASNYRFGSFFVPGSGHVWLNSDDIENYSNTTKWQKKIASSILYFSLLVQDLWTTNRTGGRATHRQKLSVNEAPSSGFPGWDRHWIWKRPMTRWVVAKNIPDIIWTLTASIIGLVWGTICRKLPYFQCKNNSFRLRSSLKPALWFYTRCEHRWPTQLTSGENPSPTLSPSACGSRCVWLQSYSSFFPVRMRYTKEYS